jgi:glycosyltransferase involved in cell wall biosynthesis
MAHVPLCWIRWVLEVIGDCGCFFDRDRLEDSLTEVLQELVDHPERVDEFRGKIRSRIENYYNWEWITSFYEELFRKMLYEKYHISYDQYLSEIKSECV